MTVGATDIVAPVFAAPEVVVFFSTGVARETCFGSFFGRFIFERNYFSRIAFFAVGLAWPMARFAPGCFPLPTADLRKSGMRGMRVGFELILVAILARFAADVIAGGDLGNSFCRRRIGVLGETTSAEQKEGAD